MKVERVSVADNFFQRAGRPFAADGALLLEDPASTAGLSNISMRDVYLQSHNREARRSSGVDRRGELRPDEARAVPHPVQS